MSPKRNMADQVSSLQNALRLLNLFTVDEPELSVSQLAEKLGVGLSTAHRLASTIAEEGFLRKDPVTKRYRPGSMILSMGNIVLSYLDVYRISAPYLESLAKKTGETAHVCILNDDHVIYLNKVDGKYPASLLSHIGRRNPAHCTSSGQVILAYQPWEVIERVAAKGLKPFTNKTITSPETFFRLMKQIKQRGYAVSLEELHDGVNSVAAPIRHPDGKVTASVSIAGPAQRINHRTIPQLVKALTDTANEISAHLAQNVQGAGI